jgi:hypothetical protein
MILQLGSIMHSICGVNTFEDSQINKVRAGPKDTHGLALALRSFSITLHSGRFDLPTKLMLFYHEGFGEVLPGSRIDQISTTYCRHFCLARAGRNVTNAGSHSSVLVVFHEIVRFHPISPRGSIKMPASSNLLRYRVSSLVPLSNCCEEFIPFNFLLFYYKGMRLNKL